MRIQGRAQQGDFPVFIHHKYHLLNFIKNTAGKNFTGKFSTPIHGADGRVMYCMMSSTTKRKPASERVPRTARTTIAAQPARFLRSHYASPFGDRDYLLFIPEKQPRAKCPLIVMLHGCHQDAEDFATGTRMNQHGLTHGCFVLYPQQSRLANGARCWNWYESAHQQREQGEPAIIADLTRDVLTHHAIASERVYVAGFSAGGAMAATLAVRYPELYAALGIHSGMPHGAARNFMSALMAMQHGTMASYGAHPMHSRIPTIVFHGNEDNMVHATHAAQFLANTSSRILPDDGELHRYIETVPRQLGLRGYTRTVQLGDDARIFSEQWMVHGAGHAWSGGDAAGTHSDPYGPDASREMMRFFLEH